MDTINEPSAVSLETESGPPILSSTATQDLAKIVSFMREGADHVVFKRFDKLNLYNLLALQHRLTELDVEIGRCEREHNSKALAQLLPTLNVTLMDYSKLLLNSRTSCLNCS